DVYSPYPVEELDRAVGSRHGIMLPLLVVAGALFGAFAGYFVQYWAAAIDYPVNTGGRPYDSLPAFTVSAFEVTLLFAIAAGFVGFLIAARLPLLYHPVFAAADFARASQDRFLLCVEARDPRFDAAHVRRILEQHGAERIDEVPG